MTSHLLGFAGSLYGQCLSLDFFKKIRDTKPFVNAQELIGQIQKDVREVKKILNV